LDKSLHAVRVDAIVDEAPGIRAFQVTRVDGEPFDQYEPGAHVDVLVADAPMRQYSLCGDPRNTVSYWFAVKKEAASRGGSRALHDIHVGSVISLGLPRNLFRLMPQATHHHLIAAGIGITPLLSMAYRLLETQAPFTLHYFIRSPSEAAFIPLLSAPPFDAHVRLHIGTARDALEATLLDCLKDTPSGSHVYTCGPAPFMDRVVAAAEQVVPGDHVHLERFGVEPLPEGAIPGTEGAFEVQLAQSGRRVTVPAGVTIVEALAKIGVEIDTSCGEGICGTCMVDVLEGELDHRDHCLSKSERAAGDVICCCVSRATSPLLVLDL
jgi:vanillate O-demethylase ferredoxin subunit